MAALVAIGVVYDWRTRGRPHWLLPCGGVLLVVAQVTRRAVASSEAWAIVGSWLVGS
jgi:hypothetical protein